MAESSMVDTFKLCWRAIMAESKAFNDTLFCEKHCLPEEVRDMDFDKVENRLAYLYKFGSFNIQLVRKCVTTFLTCNSEGKKFLSTENMKICSLSNGPGLDLIGFLFSIYDINKSYKNIQSLKIINLYKSWWNICRRILFDDFQVNWSLTDKSFDFPTEFIKYVQSDVYSDLTPEAKDCIRDSNIVLMIKVFQSSKATLDVVMKSMMEIFSLLKPGSFVIFVGSKKNVKELTENESLNKFAECIFSPVKITVADLPVDEDVVKKFISRPKESGYAHLFVWQKKSDIILGDPILIVEIPKKKTRRSRKSKTKKAKEILNGLSNASDELKDCIDSCSDTSFDSSDQQSEASSEREASSEKDLCQSVSLDKSSSNDLIDDKTLLQNKVFNSKQENFKKVLIKNAIAMSKYSDDINSYSGKPSRKIADSQPSKTFSDKLKIHSPFSSLEINDDVSISGKEKSQEVTDKTKDLNSLIQNAIAMSKYSDDINSYSGEPSKKISDSQLSKTFSDKLKIHSPFPSLEINDDVSVSEKEKSQEVTDKTKDLNSLIQRCEILISSLEKVTVNLINDFTLSNEHHSRCFSSQPCKSCHSKHRTPEYSPCCLHNVNSVCHKRVHKCQMYQKNVCTLNHNACACCSIKDKHCCSKQTQSHNNISKPHISIPVEKEDIMHILTHKNLCN